MPSERFIRSTIVSRPITLGVSYWSSDQVCFVSLRGLVEAIDGRKSSVSWIDFETIST